jgi:hypothetical protein
MSRIRSNRLLNRVSTVPAMTSAAVSWWQIARARIQLRPLLFTALVAGVFTQLPGPGAALSRAAFAATASGDAVIVWNARAGEAR